jgi:hypothetical protein
MHDIGNAALNLAQRWRAHANDSSAAGNTLFAVFGVASPMGRFADRYINVPYTIWLDDIVFANGLSAPQEPARADQRPRSPAAAAIFAHGLSRQYGRRLAMMPETHAALVAYFHEKLDLLAEIAALDARYRQHPKIRKLHQRKIAAHIRACQKLFGKPQFS